MASLLVFIGAWGASSLAADQAVEADWFHQDEVRAAAAAGGPAGGGRGVAPEEDAAGACDGVKDGGWGFHTENEANPWWEVDLGAVLELDRALVYNRCDAFAARNARLEVLLSSDRASWTTAYRHDGSVFYGFTDRRPLAVSLVGAAARYVRLRLPGTSYFHLDEVEIFARGSPENRALGRPATQSSTSPWSKRAKGASAPSRPPAIGAALERGRRLAARLRELGVPADRTLAELAAIAEEWDRSPAAAGGPRARELYLRSRRAVRRLAFTNPLLDFESILFVKRAPGLLPHIADQHYGWWSRPGGGIYVLEGFKGGEPRLSCLTSSFPPGSFIAPDISYEGTRFLFAYAKHYPGVSAMEKVDKTRLPEDSFYHVFEMRVDGTELRQLTSGRYDDFDPRYLPGGDIAFLSTRKGQSVQCGRASAQATLSATLPDSYVRCGGDNRRPCAVFTLHAMGPDGGEVRAISAFENFEWTPSIADDGRILYARWDYIDRFNGHFMSLWSTNPDGTNPALVYGNYTASPQCIFEARSIPGSARLVFTATAHHSITGGSICLLDPNAGTEGHAPLARLTPEVCFPEAEGWRSSYYANPYPLSEEFFLVAWSDRALPPHHGSAPVADDRNPVNAMGIYLMDAFGNLELLHRDPAISSMYPMPVKPRPRPPARSDTVDWEGRPAGHFILQDVYRGLAGIERGEVRRLRIVAVPPKPQPHMNVPNLGVSSEDPGKFVLGTVPVEDDGSAYFCAPPGVSLFFQALDREGFALQTMRSLTYVQPGTTASCIGCHEPRTATPAVRRTPAALARAPSRIAPGPEGSWPLRFDDLVQPVLDSACVRCHAPASGDEAAARFDLSRGRAYEALIGFAGEDLKKLAFERDFSTPGDCPARRSKLLALLRDGAGHHGVRLDPGALERLLTWIDTYAHRQGSFSDDQERELGALRGAWGYLLERRPE